MAGGKDLTERVYEAAQERLKNYQPEPHVSDLAAAGNKERFGKLAANWEMDGMKCAERWCFA